MLQILAVVSRTGIRCGHVHLWSRLEEREDLHQIMKQEPISGPEQRKWLGSILSEFWLLVTVDVVCKI